MKFKIRQLFNRHICGELSITDLESQILSLMYENREGVSNDRVAAGNSALTPKYQACGLPEAEQVLNKPYNADADISFVSDCEFSIADEKALRSLMIKVEFGNATIHEMEKVDALTRKKWKWGSDQS